MMDTIEAGPKRGSKGRRQWSEALRRQIVAETLEPDASVSVVARRHDVNANLVFTWRRQYREGPLRDGAGATAMIPVQVAAEKRPAPPALPETVSTRAGLVEIALPGGIKVRVRGAVDSGTLQQILAVLSRQ
jgi:transposase